jgi:putative membrane protein
MKPILIALAACAVCAAPAFAQASSSGNADQNFVDFAAQTDMMEAHLAQMAMDKASAQGVKDYAQMLKTDHTNDYQQLGAAATKAGLTVPKGLDAAHDRMIAPLDKLKGTAFDHKYIQMMITGHEQAIARYKREANDGQNADMKAYANTALPVLQKHLDGAKDIATPHKR